MFLTRSLKQKIAATCGAVFGFVLFYEVTMLDSKTTVAEDAEIQETTAKPAPGVRLRFAATAYCKGTTTASGTNVRTGIAAADPDLLPVGSVIQIDSLGQRYNGIYTILDTGPAVQGRHVDLYMWSCNEALSFGAKKVSLNVLRLGWNPRASNPTVIRSILDQRERQMSAPPDIPPPASVPPETPQSTPTPPASPAPSQPAPSQPAPSQPAPSQPAPTQPAPTRESQAAPSAPSAPSVPSTAPQPAPAAPRTPSTTPTPAALPHAAPNTPAAAPPSVTPAKPAAPAAPAKADPGKLH